MTDDMVNKEILYPIGVQTFGKVIEGGYLYIDKTGYVYDLARLTSKVPWKATRKLCIA